MLFCIVCYICVFPFSSWWHKERKTDRLLNIHGCGGYLVVAANLESCIYAHAAHDMVSLAYTILPFLQFWTGESSREVMLQGSCWVNVNAVIDNLEAVDKNGIDRLLFTSLVKYFYWSSGLRILYRIVHHFLKNKSVFFNRNLVQVRCVLLGTLYPDFHPFFYFLFF